MAAYVTSYPSGIPGDISRVDDSTVEPVVLGQVAGVYPQFFGAPMVYQTTAGKTSVAQWQTSNVAADFAACSFVRPQASRATRTSALQITSHSLPRSRA